MSATLYFTHLHKQEKAAADHLEKIRKAIEAGQEICEHDYAWKANDSHYHYYVCGICGHQYKE